MFICPGVIWAKGASKKLYQPIIQNMRNAIKKIVIGLALALQNAPVQAQSNVVMVNGKQVLLSSISLRDSAVGGKTVHLADFECNMRSKNEAFAVLLDSIDANNSKNKALDITFISFDRNGRAISEKVYERVMVLYVQVAEMNAADRSALQIKVALQAGTVKANFSPTSFLSTISIRPGSNTVSSLFRISIPGLPTKRISKVKPFFIGQAKPVVTGSVAGSNPAGIFAQSVFVEIAASDERAWYEKYNAGIIMEDGQVDILSPDLKTVLFSIHLPSIRIKSYRTIPSASGIPKIEYELEVAGSTYCSSK